MDSIAVRCTVCAETIKWFCAKLIAGLMVEDRKDLALPKIKIASITELLPLAFAPIIKLIARRGENGCLLDISDCVNIQFQ